MTTATKARKRPGPAPSDKKVRSLNLSERRAMAVAGMANERGMSLSAFVDALFQDVLDGTIRADEVRPAPPLPPLD